MQRDDEIRLAYGTVKPIIMFVGCCHEVDREQDQLALKFTRPFALLKREYVYWGVLSLIVNSWSHAAWHKHFAGPISWWLMCCGATSRSWTLQSNLLGELAELSTRASNAMILLATWSPTTTEGPVSFACASSRAEAQHHRRL